MKNRCLVLIGIAALLAQAITISGAEARKLTVTERQQMLQSRINKFQKSGDLTLKEADGFRDKEAKIIDREAHMKDANAGKLSDANQLQLEKDLNKLSSSIQKKQLAKRTLEPR